MRGEREKERVSGRLREDRGRMRLGKFGGERPGKLISVQQVWYVGGRDKARLETVDCRGL